MPRISDMELTSFDTETTGLDTNTDRVVEFGAVTHRVGGEPAIRHHYIDPGVPIPEEASKVHGITGATVFGCPTFGQVADMLARCLSTGMLLGYNASDYDTKILNAEFARAGHPFRIDPARVLDPLVFVRWHLRGKKGRRLGEMCEHFGVVLDNAHTAVADANATLQLVDCMLAENLIPDDLEQALYEQWQYESCQKAEYRQWGSWLYRDRQTGEIRWGAGRAVGSLLTKADLGYMKWILTNVDHLPTGAQWALRSEISRRNGIPPKMGTLFGRAGWP